MTLSEHTGDDNTQHMHMNMMKEYMMMHIQDIHIIYEVVNMTLFV